jgi:hypothetical protein
MIVYFSAYKYVKGVWSGDYETLKTVTTLGNGVQPLIPRKGDFVLGLTKDESEHKVTKVKWDKTLRSVNVHVEKV